MSILFLELNEDNFDDIERYVALEKLPVLGGLIKRHGITETTSERRYEELEPWIQWVTAHTGLDYADHGVFRLGDIVAHDLPQIWEILEAQGLSVGAVSPMNAKNRCNNPAFFVPDPWTRTIVSGSALMRRLYDAIAQAVNDNASARITPRSGAWLAAGLIAYARPTNWAKYLSLIAGTRNRPWAKALVLDQLLADLFIKQVRAKRPDFASLFLNAAAHIQHHYMYNSAVYDGPLSNPAWYLKADSDPVLEVYELYDRIVGQVARLFPNARLMLATGLHQNPHGSVTYYWRLRNHEEFLSTVGVPFDRVETLMSRDFVLHFDTTAKRDAAANRFEKIMGPDGHSLFITDKREDSLFVTLVWAGDIPRDFIYRVDGRKMLGMRDAVAFVAIKNGEHDGTGYFVDTGTARQAQRATMSLRNLPKLVTEACGAQWETEASPRARAA